MRLRSLLLLLIAGLVVALVPLVYSASPDPIWIGGFYDDADLDAIWHITSAVGVIDLCPPDAGSSILVVLALLPWLNADAETASAFLSLPPRAPPAA